MSANKKDTETEYVLLLTTEQKGVLTKWLTTIPKDVGDYAPEHRCRALDEQVLDILCTARLVEKA